MKKPPIVKIFEERQEIINSIVHQLKTTTLPLDNKIYLLSNGLAIEPYDSTPTIIGVRVVSEHSIKLEVENEDRDQSYSCPSSDFDIEFLIDILEDILKHQSK
jgi:hypothetical protein